MSLLQTGMMVTIISQCKIKENIQITWITNSPCKFLSSYCMVSCADICIKLYNTHIAQQKFSSDSL